MDVTLPSGKIILGVPEGTSKEDIRAKAIKAGVATDADFGDAPPVDPAPYGFGREMLSGLTMGFGDELEAKLTDTPIEAIRAGQSKYRDENKGAALAANLLGAAPTMLIPGGAALQGVRAVGTAGKIARGLGALGTGAAAGAVSGAGESVEGQRGQGAQSGALMGAIGAPLGAAGGRVLGATGRGVRRAAQGKGLLPDVNQRANATLLGSIAASKTTPDALMDQLTEGQVLGELSRPLTALSGAATRRSPDTLDTAVSLLEKRQANRPDELRRVVSGEITPAGAMTKGRIEDVTQSIKDQASPLYDQAYAEAGRISSPTIDNLMKRPATQNAYNVAKAIASNEGVTLPDWGSWTQMSLRTADTVKKGLDDLIYTGKKPDSGIGVNQLNSLEGLRQEFVKAIDDIAPPSYKEARGIWAGAARDKEASDFGVELHKRSFNAEDVAKFMNDPTKSQSEKAALRHGFMAEFDNKLNQMSDTREVRALVNNKDMRDKISALSTITGPSAIEPLVKRQTQEVGFANKLTGGSDTAFRQAADAALDGGDVRIPTSARDGVLQALQAMRDRARMGDEKANLIGQKLLNPNLIQNQNTLRDLSTLEGILQYQAGQRGAAGVTGAGLAGSQSGSAGNR